jgi:hypothetical protein
MHCGNFNAWADDHKRALETEQFRALCMLNAPLCRAGQRCRWKRCAACNKLYAVGPSLRLRVLSVAFRRFQCITSPTYLTPSAQHFFRVLNIEFIVMIHARGFHETAIYDWLHEAQSVTSRQSLKAFPTFYGTRRFITVFTRPRHWYLSLSR